MKKISKIILATIISAFGLGFLAGSVPAYAATDVCSSKAPQEVKDAAGCYGNANQLPGVITGILNAIIVVAGLVAVVFVLIGGINYMTSAGDSAKVKKAKETILYAVIGLIIAALSFAIVNFTIGNIIYGEPSNSNNSQEEDDEESSTPKANSSNTPRQETK